MDKRRNEELLNSVANSIKSDKKEDISEKYGLSSALKSLLEEQNALNKQDETRVKKEEIKFVKLNEEEKDKKEISEIKKDDVKVKEDVKPNISVEKMKEIVEESKKSGDDVLKKQIDSILSSYKDTDEDKSKENLNKDQKEQIVVELDENKAVTYKFKKLEVSDKQKAAIDQFFGVSEEMEKRRKKDDKIYTLTSKGRDADLKSLDFSVIYKMINKEIKQKKNSSISEDVISVDEKEIVENHWREELIEKLKKFPPAKFEMFARKLVAKMNVDMDEKIGVQVSNDGGLDGYGYITSDDFRTARVAIQAKRWEGNVPSPEIDKFRGAMDKYNAEFGIFITTSKFSKAAIETSRLGTRTITLIDGDIIVDLVAKYELYVRPVTTYVLDDFYDS